MKALTIKQPWATLIMHHGKDVENRNWGSSFRGQVAITSSVTSTDYDYENAMELMEMLGKPFPRCSAETIPRGCILGTVEVYDCVKESDSPWFFGEYGFLLRDPRPLAVPIPIKGKLGFWDLPEDIEQAIAAELGDHL
jgi:hypothetical protein